jgi:hypothetical protein
MAACILHVGMPKTGTTSIQESLYHGLDDPAFRYLGLGWTNSASYLVPLFSEFPEMFWRFRAKRYSRARIEQVLQSYACRLRKALRQARTRSQTPIISAEHCWLMPPTDLERLRDFLVAEGFVPKVVAYVRPIKSFIESAFQQRVKWGHGAFSPMPWPVPDGHTDFGGWSGTLALFERIWGRSNLIVRPFVKSELYEACAVRDFCHLLDITFDPRKVMHSNHSLCEEAVRFLFAHNRFVQRGIPRSFHKQVLLVKYFERLEGNPFRFHSTIFEPEADRIADETRAVQERYGIDIAEDPHSADHGPCVREEADLFRYSRASLEWLADASASEVIGSCEGEAAARAVAGQVERVYRHPSWKERGEWLMGWWQRTIRWGLRGD